LKAFDLTAVDYLVKPFEDERFERAFRRARRMVELEEVEQMTKRLLAVLQRAEQSARPPAAPGEYLERIAVQMTGQVRVVPVQDIDHITASGPYVELHVGGRKYVVRE